MCYMLRHLLDVLEALHFDDPQARHMQLPCSVRVDLDVQLFSILTQQVSEIQKRNASFRSQTMSWLSWRVIWHETSL